MRDQRVAAELGGGARGAAGEGGRGGHRDRIGAEIVFDDLLQDDGEAEGHEDLVGMGALVEMFDQPALHDKADGQHDRHGKEDRQGNGPIQHPGTGGLSELSSALSPTEAQYAYVRIEYANDTESKRVKFVLIIWIGEGTKVMRKARVSIESGAVKRVLGHHSIQVDARDKGDLEEEEIVKRLRKAGGADYNGGRG